MMARFIDWLLRGPSSYETTGAILSGGADEHATRLLHSQYAV